MDLICFGYEIGFCVSLVCKLDVLPLGDGLPLGDYQVISLMLIDANLEMFHKISRLNDSVSGPQ